MPRWVRSTRCRSPPTGWAARARSAGFLRRRCCRTPRLGGSVAAVALAAQGLAAMGGPNMQANMLSAMRYAGCGGGGRGADAPIAQAEGGQGAQGPKPAKPKARSARTSARAGAAQGADGGAAAAVAARPRRHRAAPHRDRRDQPRGGRQWKGSRPPTSSGTTRASRTRRVPGRVPRRGRRAQGLPSHRGPSQISRPDRLLSGEEEQLVDPASMGVGGGGAAGGEGATTLRGQPRRQVGGRGGGRRAVAANELKPSESRQPAANPCAGARARDATSEGAHSALVGGLSVRCAPGETRRSPRCTCPVLSALCLVSRAVLALLPRTFSAFGCALMCAAGRVRIVGTETLGLRSLNLTHS